MGANSILHYFTASSWKEGISELKEEVSRYSGHHEGYSGEIDSISHFYRHRPTVELKTEEAIEIYTDERLEWLNKGEAEVINLGVKEYSIAKPSFEPYTGRAMPKQVFQRPAALFRLPAGYGYPEPLFVEEGTVAELKALAASRVLDEVFKYDYVIIGKSLPTPVLVTGRGTLVNSTKLTSDSTRLIIPYYNWVVYGWARC